MEREVVWVSWDGAAAWSISRGPGPRSFRIGLIASDLPVDQAAGALSDG